MTKIGSGYISVDADLDPFWRRIDRELAGLDSRFKSAGRSSGAAFGDGFTGADRALKGVQSAVRNADRDARKAQKGFAGLAAAAGGGGNFRRLGRNLDEFGGAANGATATIGGFKIAIAGVVPVLVSFSGAAVAAASSLGPLIGLAAGAGNALAAAGQGLGVFKLATAGISDALKEQTTNQTRAAGAAVSGAGQQRSAARAIQSAQDGVRQATEQLTSAERDAKTSVRDLAGARTEARRALVDMRSALMDATISERQAVLGLKDARAELARLNADASTRDLVGAQQDATAAAHDESQAQLDVNDAIIEAAKVNSDASSTAADREKATLAVAKAQDALNAAHLRVVDSEKALADIKAGPSEEERAKAALDVAAAQQQVVESQRERVRQEKALKDAEKAGVEGSQQVVDAKLAIADANKRVDDAQRDVLRATQALSDAQLSANESMAAGAVAASALNDKFNALPPAAQAFVRQLESMKPRLDELRSTAAAGFFPGATEGLKSAARNFEPLQRVVAHTSTVLGDLAARAGALIGSSAFGRDLETIGNRNAKVIDTLGTALLHVVSALRHVAVAAGPLTQWLADVAEKWALNAAEAAKAGRESGKLAGFFERTRAIAERLGSIIGHLASGLLGLGKVGRVTGDKIWASIDRAAGRFDEWANSTRGQKSLHEFFERSTELAGALARVMGGLVKGLALVTLRILPLSTVLRALGPYADEAVVAFIAYKIAVIAAGVASKIATAATWAYNAAVAIQSVNMVRWRITLLAAAAASGVVTAAQWLLNVAMTANPIALVIVAVAALVGAFVLLGGKLSWIGDAFSAVWGAVKTGAEFVLGWLSEHWPLVLAIITGPIGLAVLAVVQNWDAIKSATERVWNAIKGFLGGVWNGIKSVATTIFNAIAGFIGGVWDGIRTVATGAWNVLKAVASTAWDGIKTVIVNPIKSAVGLIGDFWDDIKKGAKTGWDDIKQGVSEFAKGFADKVTGAFKGVVGIVEGFINSILKAVNLIPGVPNIPLLGGNDAKSTANGANAGGVQGAIPGRFQGGLVDRPMVMVGEEAPQHPEFVIPTNPAYRGRAIALTQSLMRELGMDGMPGYAKGGILGDAASSVWGLLRSGAKGILGGLPGVDVLPDWIQGMGSYVLKKVGGFIKNQFSGLFEGAAGTPAIRLIRMMNKAVDIDRKGFPYVYGGGHGSFEGPYDCSGAVSAILHAGGLLPAPITTDGLKVFGESGDGEHVTIGVRGSTGRQAHTMMKIADRWFESGSGHGAKFTDGWSGSFPIHRHPAGLAMGGVVQDVLENALDPRKVGWGLARGGILPNAGSFLHGGMVGGPVGAPAAAVVHGGEVITPKGADLIGALRENTATMDRMIRTGLPGVMNSIADHTLERGGQESHRRRMTAGNPAVTAHLP